MEGGGEEIMEIMEGTGEEIMESGGEEITANQPSGLELQRLPSPPAPLRKIILVASIAAGIQFGWALQLSLLTPYVQLLGIPHKLSSISGMIVQPLVSHYSDCCNSRFGRHSQFIEAGAGLVIIAVVLISFAADIGHLTGDSLRAGSIRQRAIAVFVMGFWSLDVGNNMLHGSCRAFLADLSAGNQRKTRIANAFFSFFMAVGNILGYGAGSLGNLDKVFPFTKTKACNKYCANLKSCFFLSIALLIITLITVAFVSVREKSQSQPEPRNAGDTNGTEKEGEEANPESFFRQLLGALKNLPRSMWILLLVTCLNWIAWFPFLLYDADWMGREVYGGNVGAGATVKAKELYNNGVRAGALGHVLDSVVLGVASLGIEHMVHGLGGVSWIWSQQESQDTYVEFAVSGQSFKS